MSERPVGADTGARFSVQMMHAAATLYYLQDATQAEIAERLGTSRPTVSRLLSEARRQGIVRIEVVAPRAPDADSLSAELAHALDLRSVRLTPPVGPYLGATLAPVLSQELLAVGLEAGDVLLIASGRTIYEVAQAELPAMPGVIVVPGVGGQDEIEAWYQTNELTRTFAARVGGHPRFLYAPATPGPELYEHLVQEPSIRRVLELWERAECAVLGIGAPVALRQSLPGFVPAEAAGLGVAVGDVCVRFFDRTGAEVGFPGSERMLALSVEQLRRIPVSIAVAVGQEKSVGIVAGARGRLFNSLITDVPTAQAVLLYLSS